LSTALDIIFNEHLRPYQVAYLKDFSPRRIVLKARRIGLSYVAALDVVLTTSGIWEALGAPVVTHNYNVISKRDRDAQAFIRYCHHWIDVLSADPMLGPYVDKSTDAATHITFRHSGRRIQSDTQSPMAARGDSGHLLKDESAHYKWAREIVESADIVPLSDPSLRLTEFSTPNGTAGMGEVFYRKWSNEKQYGDYSRHRIDIHRAIADGFSVTVEKARASVLTDDSYRQEFECAFLGTGDEYFDLGLLQGAQATRPATKPDRVVMGIDVASLVDLTAVVLLYQHGAATYAGETYLVGSTPYASRDGVMGQEDIVDALLRYHRPDLAIMDATSDGAELYGRCIAKGSGVPIVPHNFSSNGQRWKQTHVPRMRTAIEDGTLMLSGDTAYIYQPGLAQSAHDAEEFVDVAFKEHHSDVLALDFLKVRKKLLQSGVTFDTDRDRDGHGDAFWAACMAFSLCETHAVRRSRPKKAPKRNDDSLPQLPSYTDFL